MAQVLALGGGCFWCTEAVFVRVRGVLDVESGYCNGQTPAPSYEAVCTGLTGHCEVIRLVYEPSQVSLDELLDIFFLIHDPTTLNRQGNDAGTQYRSGIYTTTHEQLMVAKARVEQLRQEDIAAVTEVQPLSNYWPAEDYHQDFFENHPNQGYCLAVAAPKVAKFRQTFQHLVEDHRFGADP